MQKLPFRITHHTFLESRHPEVTKNPYYVFSPKWSQKRGSAHGLLLERTWFILILFTGNWRFPTLCCNKNGMTNGEEETRSLWQLSCLCSELRICLRQNQNKEKKLLLKKLHHKHLLLMLYQSKNFRELLRTV